MTELKPCPFCGTIPRVIKKDRPIYPYAIDHGIGQVDYMCPMEWVVIGGYSSEEKAIAHWNRRVEE